MGIKALAVLVMAGGTVLAGPTGGASLTATYAAGTYLAADSAYSAIKGHTMLTGTQLTTEERIWAGIDSAVTIASMGSAGYLAKLAKSGAEGSTLLKNLATAGTHADDVNDFTKVVYAVGTGKDPSSDIQNLMFGQIMGLGMNSAGNYIGKKFGAPTVDVPGTKPSHLDVPLQGKQIPKLDPDSVRFNSRQDLHLKASPADGTLAKLKNHPTVSMDVPKVKDISGDNVFKAVSGVKPSDVDVPKVKDVHDVEASKYDIERIKENIKESKLARESSNFDQYLEKEKFQKTLIGMDPMDRQSYLQWHEYAEAGIEPSDRVKLRNWSNPPEPEFYLKNKNVYDNPDYFNQLTGGAIYPGTPESSLGRVDGSIHKYGFLNGKYKESVILPGTRINRIGSNPTGRYFSPEGATFGEKALPPFMKLQPNSDYIVLKEIPTKEGLVAPWFDEPGMGIQHYTYLTIDELEKGRFLLRLK